MKYRVLFICLSFSVNCLAQTSGSNVVNDAYKKASGNEKTTWAGYLSGLFQSSSGQLELQGTPYGIFNVINHDTLDYGFRRPSHVIFRNTQIALGVTPNSKTQYHIDKANYGFSYAIFNNKKAPRSFYTQSQAEINSNQALLSLIMRRLVVDRYLRNRIINPKGDSIEFNINFYAAWSAFDNNNDTTKLTPQLRNIIITYLGIGSLKEVFSGINSVEHIYNEFTQKKMKLFLGTEAFKFNEDFTNGHAQFIADSITGSKVWCVSSNLKNQFSTQGSILREWTDDTIKKTSNFGRDFMQYKFDLDAKINWFELTGEFGYSHYYSGLYKNEKSDQYAVSLTPRFKISSSLTIPITFKYVPTPGKAQFFGFLDIQYSLK